MNDLDLIERAVRVLARRGEVPEFEVGYVVSKSGRTEVGDFAGSVAIVVELISGSIELDREDCSTPGIVGRHLLICAALDAGFELVYAGDVECAPIVRRLKPDDV